MVWPSEEEHKAWKQFVDGKHCPFNYNPCKWSNPNSIGCVRKPIPSEEKNPANKWKVFSYLFPDDDDVSPCRSPTELKRLGKDPGLSCKLD